MLVCAKMRWPAAVSVIWHRIRELEQRVGEMSTHCRGLEQDVTELQQTNQVSAHIPDVFSTFFPELYIICNTSKCGLVCSCTLYSFSIITSPQSPCTHPTSDYFWFHHFLATTFHLDCAPSFAVLQET